MIGTRLRTTPAIQFADNSRAGVGWYNEAGPFFIVTLEPYNKNGKAFPGYYAICRLDGDYPTKASAENALRRWLGTSLI